MPNKYSNLWSSANSNYTKTFVNNVTKGVVPKTKPKVKQRSSHKPSKYFIRDLYTTPEMVVTPKRTGYVTDQYGNPSVTVDALGDINPNAPVYTRNKVPSKGLPDMRSFRTQPTNKEASRYADYHAAKTAPTIGDLIMGGVGKPMNLINLSHWVGAIRDWDKNKGWANVWEDNSGVLTKQYAERHPWQALAANMLTDSYIASNLIGGIKGFKNLRQINKEIKTLEDARNARNATNVSNSLISNPTIRNTYITPSSSIRSIAQPLDRQVTNTVASRSSRATYNQPVTNTGSRFRDDMFERYTDNIIDDDQIAELVGLEHNIPASDIRTFMDDYFQTHMSLNPRQALSRELGADGYTGYNFSRFIDKHFIDNLPNETRNNITRCFTDVGLNPNLEKVARLKRMYNYSLDHAVERAVEEDLENPDILSKLADPTKAMVNSITAQNFMRKYGLDMYDLKKLLNETYGSSFNALDKNISELLTNTGATSSLKTLLNMTPTNMIKSGKISNGDLRFYFRKHGSPIHFNITRKDPYQREKLIKYAERFKEAAKPENQYKHFEQLGIDFSADSVKKVLKDVLRLSKKRIENGGFPGIIGPNPRRSYPRSVGNDYANVNLGDDVNPRIGSVFGAAPSEQEILTYRKPEVANNEINYLLAQLYKHYGTVDPSYYKFDNKLLDDVIKAGGDVSSIPGAENATFFDGTTPLFSIWKKGNDAPEYPSIMFGFKNGGTIHINPVNRGKFNATKRRTGKTTEELTHSKNPKTRKRAIFAQNAAKWRKRS